jgi:hypothetical protein
MIISQIQLFLSVQCCDRRLISLPEHIFLQDNFEANGIRPGGSYSVSDIQSTLVKTLGGDAFLHCQGNNVLVEVNLRLPALSKLLATICLANQPRMQWDEILVFMLSMIAHHEPALFWKASVDSQKDGLLAGIYLL